MTFERNFQTIQHFVQILFSENSKNPIWNIKFKLCKMVKGIIKEGNDVLILHIFKHIFLIN